MNTNFYLASHNPHKLREAQEILGSQIELKGIPSELRWEENGKN